MIDLTKEIKIKSNFLENVLDKKDMSECGLGDLDIDELESRLEEMESEEGIFGGTSSMEDIVGNLEDSGFDEEERETVDTREINRFDEDTNTKKFKEIVREKFVNSDDSKYEIFFKEMLFSFPYLFYMIYKSVKNRTKDDLGEFLIGNIIISSVFTVITILMKVGNLNTILEVKQMIISSLTITVISALALFQDKNKVVTEEEIEEELEELDDEGYTEEEDTEEEDTEEEDTEEEDEEEYENYGDYEEEISATTKEYLENFPIPENILNTSLTKKQLINRLTKSIELSERKRLNCDYTDRESIFNSLSEFIFCNNPGFSEQKKIAKNSIVYNNISFLIYEGLRAIYSELTYTGEYTMEVLNLVESKLFYRLEVKLPRLVKLTRVNLEIEYIETKFKKNESDNDVCIKVSSYSDYLIFKVMKDSRTPVTIGDVIRYYDEDENYSVYEDFFSNKFDLPIIAGLQNEEKPLPIDLADDNETNIAILGASGSGKSWVIFSFVFNLILQSHPGDVSFVLMDFKKDPQFTALGRLPHILGCFSGEDIDNFIDIVKEINLELERRKAICDKFNVSKWSDLRKIFEKDVDNRHKFPWLFLIIDETPAILNALRTMSKKDEFAKEFIQVLSSISKQARSYGMKIVMTAQRSVNTDFPRDIYTQCSIVYALKLNERDLKLADMLDKNIPSAERTGIAVFKKDTFVNKVSMKCLGIGGIDSEQTQQITRAIALEWHLRIDEETYYDTFCGMRLTDNRRQRREQVMGEYSRGIIFTEDIKGLSSEEINRVIGKATEKVYGIKYEEKEYEKEIERPLIVAGKKKENAYVTSDVTEEDEKGKGNLKDIDEEENIVGVEEIDNVDREKREEIQGLIELTAKQKMDRLRMELAKKKIQLEAEESKSKEIDTTNNQDSREYSNINRNPLNVINKRRIDIFIKKYSSNGRIRKSELEEIFPKEDIQEALNDILIVEDGEHYLA